MFERRYVPLFSGTTKYILAPMVRSIFASLAYALELGAKFSSDGSGLLSLDSKEYGPNLYDYLNKMND